MNRYIPLRALIPGTFFLLALSWASLPVSGQTRSDLAKSSVPILEKILKENIAAFWYPRCLDRHNGGYLINFGPKGEARPGGSKGIVTQARMVWLFSKMVREGYAGKEFLEAAHWGYKFLMEKMWDSENGGFFWEVDATGGQAVRPLKHLYGQAFALYAISEYYLASHDPEAQAFANRIFDLLESKAHDSQYGGYVECFSRDWKTPGAENYMGKDRTDLKLMNTHLHLLEAMTTYYRASLRPEARERLLELIAIQSNSVVRKNVGACTDEYERNWAPLLTPRATQASYGHDLENIWLLIDACRAAGLPNSLFLDLYRTLFDYSLQYGYDGENGGFYDSGPLSKPADSLNKTCWVEAEAMVSALNMYRLTKEDKYARVFSETLRFVQERLVDWQFGEWYEKVTLEGDAGGDKAHLWKAGYHNGRSMMECLAILKAQDLSR